MTKITLRPDQAAFAAEVLQLDQGGSRRFEPVAPLHHHRSPVEQLVEPEIPELRRGLDAIEVDVRKLQPSRVHANQLKCGTCDRRGRRYATGHPADKGRLSSSQLACQENHVTDAQPLAEALAERLGFRG